MRRESTRLVSFPLQCRIIYAKQQAYRGVTTGMDRTEAQPPIVNILGARVALGPIEREHIPLFQRWNNDFAVTRTLWRSEPWTVEQMTAAYDATRSATDQIHVILYERASMQPIGSAYLTHIDHRDRT